MPKGTVPIGAQEEPVDRGECSPNVDTLYRPTAPLASEACEGKGQRLLTPHDGVRGARERGRAAGVPGIPVGLDTFVPCLFKADRRVLKAKQRPVRPLRAHHGQQTLTSTLRAKDEVIVVGLQGG